MFGIRVQKDDIKTAINYFKDRRSRNNGIAKDELINIVKKLCDHREDVRKYVGSRTSNPDISSILRCLELTKSDIKGSNRGKLIEIILTSLDELWVVLKTNSKRTKKIHNRARKSVSKFAKSIVNIHTRYSEIQRALEEKELKKRNKRKRNDSSVSKNYRVGQYMDDLQPDVPPGSERMRCPGCNHQYLNVLKTTAEVKAEQKQLDADYNERMKRYNEKKVKTKPRRKYAVQMYICKCAFVNCALNASQSSCRDCQDEHNIQTVSRNGLKMCACPICSCTCSLQMSQKEMLARMARGIETEIKSVQNPKTGLLSSVASMTSESSIITNIVQDKTLHARYDSGVLPSEHDRTALKNVVKKRSMNRFVSLPAQNQQTFRVRNNNLAPSVAKAMFVPSAAPSVKSNDMASEDYVLDADDREYMKEMNAKIPTPMGEAEFKNLLMKSDRVRKKLLKKKEAKKKQRFKNAEAALLELLSADDDVDLLSDDDDKENGVFVLC